MRIGNLPDSGLHALKVGEMRRVICAAPTYLNEHGRPQHPDELLQAQLVVATSSPLLSNWEFNGPDGAISIRPQPRLLVSANHLQMTRADKKVELIVEVLAERGIDGATFPVVFRMFGPKEAEARAAAARIPNIHYPPGGTPMEDVCRLIVDLTKKAAGAAR